MLCQKLSRYVWIPTVLARIFLGAFFALVGFQKLFVPYYHFTFLNLLKKIHFFYPEISSYVIAFLEGIFGLFIFLGLFTQVCSFGLFILCLSSFFLTKLDSLKQVTYFLNFIYVPEFILSLLFLFLFFLGPQKLSLSDKLFKKKSRNMFE